MSDQLKSVATEVGKTVVGVVIGRTAVVMGEKALKVSEETDPKKKKMKEIGVGAGVTALGIAGAMKLPKEYMSVAGGVAVAGAISAASPFGKEDKGFIPVLHGTDDEYVEIAEELNALGDTTDLDEYLNRDLDEEIDDENEINSLAALASTDEEVIDVDFDEVN